VAAGAALAVLAAIECALDVPEGDLELEPTPYRSRARRHRGVVAANGEVACGMTALGWSPGLRWSAARPTSAASTGRPLPISAATGQGLEPLRRRALAAVGGADQEESEQACITTTLQQALAAAARDGFSTAGSLRRVGQRRVPCTPVAIAFSRRAQTRSRTSAVRRLRRATSDASLTSSSTAELA